MARLAAYYQEDFHYPSVGPGHKQRKATYVVYEEPKNNLFSSYLLNGDRIRSLGSSEPNIDLMQRTHMYRQLPQTHGNRLLENRHFNDVPSSNCHFSPVESSEVYDNESVFSYSEVPTYDNKYHRNYRNRSSKRYSYAEPTNVSLHSPEMYTPQNVHPIIPNTNYRNNRNKHLNQDCYYVEQNHYVPMICQPHSNQEQWQEYNWVPVSNSFGNSTFLSPPSPLDSGLSSQSITSSPSLDAEPWFHGHACSCSNTQYPYEHGRISPSAFSVSQKAVGKPRHKHKNRHKAAEYWAENYDNNSPHVRYGKLGLVGEATENDQDLSPQQNLNPNYLIKDSMTYVYAEENATQLQKSPQKRKSHKASSNYSRPSLVIVDKQTDDGVCSPSPEHQVKSPESPMSITNSNSASDSTSSSNELEVDQERRKASKTTEREIRELEDMYQKCNLEDEDLLDRAERRDLPTVHQRNRTLTRSNSDTLYEMMSNPYETRRRAPPFRRSGLPDRVADDMALRKLQSPTARPSLYPSAENAVTYMLCNSHFTPTVRMSQDILLLDNPDVEYDDLSYRKHYFGKKSKIKDPQPPFGIPLMPPPYKKVYSDYLHQVPSKIPQPLCHPRGNPDVVRDDMAFRTLRKDGLENVMYYDLPSFRK